MGKNKFYGIFMLEKGPNNRAEICDTVGLFLLDKVKISKLFKNGEFGNFRDDILAVI